MADYALPPLEVFALSDGFLRLTGSIPYKSLIWTRRYSKSGEFSMIVPSDVYSPEWSFIYADDRPEMGIIQKVEFSDSAATYGGVDTVTISGFFLESVLNNIVFLVESPDQKKVYVPEPRRPIYNKSQNPKIYHDGTTGFYYTNQAGDVVSVETGKVVSPEGLQEAEYRPAFGASWGSDTIECTYNYYSADGKNITVVDWRGGEKTYPISFKDDRGNVFYHDTDAKEIRQAVGVVEKRDDTYAVKKKRWDALPDDDPYGRYYLETVKGAWQRTDAMEPVTEGDSVATVLNWARRMMGDWLLYEEPKIKGVNKAVDPSFQYLGDLLYATLAEVGASLRLEYLFRYNKFILSVYRGKDRTQEGNAPKTRAAAFPPGFKRLEWIESNGTQYIDTGVRTNNSTRVEIDAQVIGTPRDVVHLFGANDYATNKFFTVRSNAALNGFAFRVGGSALIDMGASAFNARHVFALENGKCSIDGVSHTAPSATFDIQFPLVLFGLNQKSGVSAMPSMRLYSAKITQGGAPSELVPAMREEDKAVGLVDVESGVFYENGGTGAFTAGPVKEPEPEPEPVPPSVGNPWAVFSDTWGTLTGYDASEDVSNYKNTCFVLYDYEKPDSFDASGWPSAGFIHAVDDSAWLPTLYGIRYTKKRGYNTEHQGSADEPAIETYLDLRDEKPTCDGDWSRDVVEIPTAPPDERAKAIEAAKEKFAKPADAYDMRAVYDAYEKALPGRGAAYLKDNHAKITTLDTGVIKADRYLKDFDLGDTVDLAVSTVGLVKTARIIEVEESYDDSGGHIALEIGDERLQTVQKARLV